jgi:hypothetical protein
LALSFELFVGEKPLVSKALKPPDEFALLVVGLRSHSFGFFGLESFLFQPFGFFGLESFLFQPFGFFGLESFLFQPFGFFGPESFQILAVGFFGLESFAFSTRCLRSLPILFLLFGVGQRSTSFGQVGLDRLNFGPPLGRALASRFL